jgi:hypothetical protein
MTKTELEILSTVLGWADDPKSSPPHKRNMGGPLTVRTGSKAHLTAVKLHKHGLVNVSVLGDLTRITSATEVWRNAFPGRAETIDDATAERIGEVLSTNLKLKHDREHRDRWVTGWGTKTNKGLARTVLWVITNMLTIK